MKRWLIVFLSVVIFRAFSLPVLAYEINRQISGPIAPDRLIEQRAFKAPDRISINKYQLTQYLIKPFSNDYDKLRVIAYWIASHIAYDSYKFDNGKANKKEMKFKYDILKAKAGICSDFALLFAQMADIANVKSVEVVTGYVLENAKGLKKNYSRHEMPVTGHAWNRVTLNGRRFFVDTTYMSANRIGYNHKYKSSLKHKLDVQKRMYTKERFNRNINTFYFDFTPRDEVKHGNLRHIMRKYVH